MKTSFFLVALLGCATLGHAQTAPATSPTPAVSGTKNVGSDRADAPQAPGMQASSTTPTRSGGAKASKRRSQSQPKSGTSSAMPKQ